MTLFQYYEMKSWIVLRGDIMNVITLGKETYGRMIYNVISDKQNKVFSQRKD